MQAALLATVSKDRIAENVTFSLRICVCVCVSTAVLQLTGDTLCLPTETARFCDASGHVYSCVRACGREGCVIE